MAKLLEEKVALITGAGRGIGRAIAETYAGHGALVAVTDIDEAQARVVARTIEDTCGGRTLALPLDVSDPAGVQRAVDRTVEAFGRIDVLVNNAATVAMLCEATVQEWMRLIPAHPSVGEALVDAAMDVEGRSLHLPEW